MIVAVGGLVAGAVAFAVVVLVLRIARHDK